MRIADVLRNKGAAVVTINPDATVGELLAGLAEQNIGAMVVVGAEGVVGIVSERDVVRQLHTYGASVLSRPVAKIMSTTVATCTKSDTVRQDQCADDRKPGPPRAGARREETDRHR